jgi:hypothetical protein
VKFGKLSFKEKENAINEVRILASIEYYLTFMLIVIQASSNTKKLSLRTQLIVFAL